MKIPNRKNYNYINTAIYLYRFVHFIATSPNPHFNNKPYPNSITNLYPNLNFCRNIMRIPFISRQLCFKLCFKCIKHSEEP